MNSLFLILVLRRAKYGACLKYLLMVTYRCENVLYIWLKILQYPENYFVSNVF